MSPTLKELSAKRSAERKSVALAPSTSLSEKQNWKKHVLQWVATQNHIKSTSNFKECETKENLQKKECA